MPQRNKMGKSFSKRSINAIMKKQYKKPTRKQLKKQYKKLTRKQLKKTQEDDYEVIDWDFDYITVLTKSGKIETRLVPGNGCEMSDEELKKWESELNSRMEKNAELKESENDDWQEVPVPTRRGVVDEPLSEEERKLKVLLENFHLTEPTPHINRQQQDADMMRDHLKRHRPN